MLGLILMLLALVGGWLHARRERDEPSERHRAIYLLWWLGLAIGVSGVLQAAAHVFNGPATAEMIGFTRGDGGFQFENAMGDLAVGVTGLLCIRFRDPRFWLAVLIVTSVQYYGDAIGHFDQWIANANTETGNVGPPLWSDIIVPTVGWIFYAAYQRAARGAVAERAAAVGE